MSGTTKAHTEDGRRIISGIAIPFNSLSVNLGGFVEKFAPSAVDRTLREIDVRALAHHDAGRLLGRVTARTLRIAKRGGGLFYELELPDTSDGRDVFELVRRRDLTGASFGFSVPDGGDVWDFSRSVPLRIVTDARISEISLVSWPAYQASTAEVMTRAVRPAATVVSAAGRTGNRVEWLQKWSRLKRAAEGL